MESPESIHGGPEGRAEGHPGHVREDAFDLHGVGERLHEIDRQTRSFVREHPVVALVGSVALGFLVGRLVSRRGW